MTDPYPRSYTQPRGVVQMLHVIPDLACEVAWTIDAPNPSERAERSSSVPGPRVPINADALDVLAAPSEDPDPARADVGRGTLAVCIRLIVEEADDAGHEVPDWPSDTWSGICGWLLATRDWWALQPWAEDVERDVATVCRELARIARMPRTLHLVCPTCGDRMQVQPGDWLLCDSGHEHPGAYTLARQYRQRPALPARDLAREFRLAPVTLRVWRNRGKIRPDRVDEAGAHYLPWDVFCLLNPGIDEAVTRAERILA